MSKCKPEKKEKKGRETLPIRILFKLKIRNKILSHKYEYPLEILYFNFIFIVIENQVKNGN